MTSIDRRLERYVVVMMMQNVSHVNDTTRSPADEMFNVGMAENLYREGTFTRADFSPSDVVTHYHQISRSITVLCCPIVSD